jgi:hypothetical protein
MGLDLEKLIKDDFLQNIRKAKSEVEANFGKTIGQKKKGSLYKVHIDATPEEMLRRNTRRDARLGFAFE